MSKSALSQTYYSVRNGLHRISIDFDVEKVCRIFHCAFDSENGRMSSENIEQNYAAKVSEEGEREKKKEKENGHNM